MKKKKNKMKINQDKIEIVNNVLLKIHQMNKFALYVIKDKNLFKIKNGFAHFVNVKIQII